MLYVKGTFYFEGQIISTYKKILCKYICLAYNGAYVFTQIILKNNYPLHVITLDIFKYKQFCLIHRIE